MKELKTTLLTVIKDNKILLALKKRGFGANKYNGVGGKLEAGETIEQAMLRETKEEIGIVPTNYKMKAINTFDEYVKGEKTKVIQYMFLATSFDGEPVESEEMKPYWFDINKIPYENMFPDDKIWLPLLIDNKTFEGYFDYDENFNILNYNIITKNEDEIK